MADVHRQRGRVLPEVWPGCEPGFRSGDNRRRHDFQRRGGDDQFLDGAGAAGGVA